MPRHLAVALALAACVSHHRVVVTAGEIVRHAPELRAHQQATVETRDEVDDGGGVRRRELVRADQTIAIDGEPHTIGSLAASCREREAGTDVAGTGLQMTGLAAGTDAAGRGIPSTACIVGGVPALPIELRRYDKREVGRALGATAFGLGVGAIIASVACGLACADGSSEKRASEVTLIGSGVVIVGGLVWVIIACATGDRCRN